MNRGSAREGYGKCSTFQSLGQKRRFVEKTKLFRILRGSYWAEIELSAEEKNTNTIVPEAAKASGGGFDALDFRVQSFGHRSLMPESALLPASLVGFCVFSSVVFVFIVWE
jgi:hypothetical protein